LTIPSINILPELKGSDWEGITVRDILHMRSGMDSKSIDFESGPFTNPQHKNYQLESALGAVPKADNTPISAYEFIKGLKKDKDAGLAAEYSNINTFVLGWLAEKVTRKRYVQTWYLKEYGSLWVRLPMRMCVFLTKD
jgi:CubicO group peptidase (beta-lactamase class C family)